MAFQETLPAAEEKEYEHMPKYKYSSLPSKSSSRLVTDLDVDRTAKWSYTFRGQSYHFPKLTCSLVTFDSQDCPEYNCLSYTCGNPHRVFRDKEDYDLNTELYHLKMPIVIDGAVLWVGRNLFEFLREPAMNFVNDNKGLFKRGTGVEFTGRLWIDAISIHQQDPVGKGHQVRMMDRVYSNASVVFSWLSASDESMERAVRCLEVIAKMDECKIERAKTVNPMNADLRSFGFGDERSPLPIHALLKKSYFRRSWILQEAALAKRVVILCGGKMILFNAMEMAARNLYLTGWWLAIAGHAKSLIEHGVSPLVARFILPFQGHSPLSGGSIYEPDYKAEFDPISMIFEIVNVAGSFSEIRNQSSFNYRGPRPARYSYKRIFTSFRALETSDPRNKIFSFLGVRPGGPIPEALTPKYTKDFTPRDVYVAATQYLIQLDMNLDILYHRECREHADSKGLPSWVPNYVGFPKSTFGESVSISPDFLSPADDRSRRTQVSFIQNDRPVV